MQAAPWMGGMGVGMCAVSADELRRFASAVLQTAGLVADAAEVTAQVLVEADLQGIESHGVSRLPVYVQNLCSGRFSRHGHCTVQTSGATGVVDGEHGIGPYVAARAMDTAIALARASGVGAVAVRNSNHFGAASCFGRMAVRQRMIGMVVTNTPAAMPPTGGRLPFFGTNPIAVSFPTGDHPIEIDLSTSVVARGKILQAARTGRPIPVDWALDGDGAPTADAGRALAGSLLPMGGAKGYALALAVEVVCSVLTRSVWGPHIGWMYDDGREPIRMGHFMGALDITRFLPWEDYLQRIDQLRRDIRSVPRMEGVPEILLPGDRRARMAAAQARHGIPLSETTREALHTLAAAFGVPDVVCADAPAPADDRREEDLHPCDTNS